MSHPLDRLLRLGELLRSEIELLQTERKLRARPRRADKRREEPVLGDAAQAPSRDAGEHDDARSDLCELEEKVGKVQLSAEAASRVKKEIKKLRMMAPMSAEAAVVRDYIDWVLALPWGVRTEDRLDVTEAERILDEDHYGLKKVKERILEYLAVQALVKKLKGPILCLVGPPGVGKTSLARSIARATGRNFVRLSLGGVRDEAEIRGHRRTYIGALPGKIIQSLKKAGSTNPVFLLDEVDKMSTDFRGDPVGGAARGARPRAEHQLQRPLPRSRLRPLRRHVHHHGELPAGDPGPAAGPHGDHRSSPATPSSRSSRSPSSYLVPKQKRDNGIGEPGHRLPRGRRARRSSTTTPRRPACATSSARSRTVCRKIAREYLADRERDRAWQGHAQAAAAYLGPAHATGVRPAGGDATRSA